MLVAERVLLLIGQASLAGAALSAGTARATEHVRDRVLRACLSASARTAGQDHWNRRTGR
jgi:hypothetical protein